MIYYPESEIRKFAFVSMLVVRYKGHDDTWVLSVYHGVQY